MRTIHTRAAAVDGTETSWNIDGYPGLVLRAFPSGTRKWSLRYQMGSGRRASRDKRFPLGDYATTSLAEAWQKARDEIRKVDAGADPAADRKAPMTVFFEGLGVPVEAAPDHARRKAFAMLAFQMLGDLGQGRLLRP